MIIGKNFLHVIDYVKHKRGTQGVLSLKEKYHLNIDEIMEGKFYPFEDYVNLLKCAGEVSEDDSIAYKIGWHRARTLLLAKGLKNYGLEILDRVASAWDGFNNFGRVIIKPHEDEGVSLVISNYGSHPIYCERTRGFIAGLMGSSDMKTVTIKEVNCVCHGMKACEFVIKPCRL
jgi:hypothetical protein